MATIHSKIVNQYRFKYHIKISATFYKINEEDQRNDETDLNINLNFYHILAESDNNIIDVKSRLEHQIQIHETKVSEWIFDKIASMKKRFL